MFFSFFKKEGIILHKRFEHLEENFEKLLKNFKRILKNSGNRFVFYLKYFNCIFRENFERVYSNYREL